MHKNCHRYGMPLSNDEHGGGTEADGTRSPMYCGHCDQQGKFTLPDITLEGMIAGVRGKLKKMYLPGFLAFFFTRNIPKLQRWSQRDT